MDIVLKKQLVSYLESFITVDRRLRFDQVLRSRTRYLSVLIEDVFQPHNASAVLRTCDCFGIQDVHIVENRNEYDVNPDVALGSSKWVSMYKHNQSHFNTPEAITSLKQQGYRIIATTPHTDDQLLDELDLSKGKMVLMFGTELNGLTDTAKSMADEYVKIPMYGFTESFNISVSASLCLHYLTEKMRKSDINWQLSQEEMVDVRLKWLNKSVKASDQIVQKFLEEQGMAL
ncbi:MAG: RNA methyltransferase [Bacteroidales bacterium]|nr:RNA methyltransferase [Bacteroidales bacterium]